MDFFTNHSVAKSIVTSTRFLYELRTQIYKTRIAKFEEDEKAKVCQPKLLNMHPICMHARGDKRYPCCVML